jgi:hypothetical protein
MTSYTNRAPGSTGDREDPARPPDDPRLVAFSSWVDSIDRGDWKAAREATRRLRDLRISAVLLAPRDDRWGA